MTPLQTKDGPRRQHLPQVTGHTQMKASGRWSPLHVQTGTGMSHAQEHLHLHTSTHMPQLPLFSCFKEYLLECCVAGCNGLGLPCPCLGLVRCTLTPNQPADQMKCRYSPTGMTHALLTPCHSRRTAPTHSCHHVAADTQPQPQGSQPSHASMAGTASVAKHTVAAALHPLPLLALTLEQLAQAAARGLPGGRALAAAATAGVHRKLPRPASRLAAHQP